ncbi:hypothetical protein [Candidatus Mesenet endosymbiont of Agriotes lineatus]|uniref:hypothetical protein n=1 Tax=Candidatus Mesenet endosymbiont of Agriotes lineatus TaxID=3077948 RepID=UPI0030D338B8
MVKNGNNNQLNKVRFEIAKLNYIDLKAPKEYQEAQSGRKMYDSLNLVSSVAPNFVIDGKEVSARDILSKVQRSNSNENDYLLFLTEAFRKTFKDAKAKIPNESILKELIANCCQYQSFINTKVLLSSNLIPVEQQRNAVHINCNSSNCVELKINREQDIISKDKENSWKGSSIPLSSSLEFKLKSNDNEIEYTDGKLFLTLTSKSMEVEQDRSLFFRLIEAVRALLHKAFGKENVKEVKHEFEFYEPKSIINGPQVENIESINPNIH